jgi:hypothetical protein
MAPSNDVLQPSISRALESPFEWADPFRLSEQLSKEESLIRDGARSYTQEQLLPRDTEAYLQERTDRETCTGATAFKAATT